MLGILVQRSWVLELLPAFALLAFGTAFEQFRNGLLELLQESGLLSSWLGLLPLHWGERSHGRVGGGVSGKVQWRHAVEV